MLGGKSLHAAGDQCCPEMGLMTDGWENGNYRSGMEVTYLLNKKKKQTPKNSYIGMTLVVAISCRMR